MEIKYCHGCDEGKEIKEFNKNGHGGYRSMCKPCEISSRLKAKRKKLKGTKNLISTNGGSSRSPQRVVRQ